MTPSLKINILLLCSGVAVCRTGYSLIKHRIVVLLLQLAIFFISFPDLFIKKQLGHLVSQGDFTIGNGMEIDSLENLLWARRKHILHQNPYEQTILGKPREEEKYEQFYAMMRKYSFRLFLRDLLEQHEKVHPEQLTKYCSLRTAQNYLNFLLRLQITDKDEQGYFYLRNPVVPNFGGTLEWYIAEIFQREFGAASRFRVTFNDGSTGGDYDVLAAWLGQLVYVEVKSAPPKGIDVHHVGTFLGRVWDLLPEVVIFSNDTHLRMKDKIVALFEEEIARQYGRVRLRAYPVQRLKDELFHVNHCLYIVNSKRGIAHNFHICLNDYLANGLKQRGMP